MLTTVKLRLHMPTTLMSRPMAIARRIRVKFTHAREHVGLQKSNIGIYERKLLVNFALH